MTNKQSQVRSYTDLVVWQKSMALAVAAYTCSRGLPTEERYGITQQLRRAVVSIPSNIAEGHGRMNNGDFVRFLAIARGSLREAETLFRLCIALGLLREDDVERAMTLADEIGRMLAVMIRTMGRKSPKR
jgi:four helix bundle protein